MLKLSEFHVLAIVTSRGLLMMDDLCIYRCFGGDFYFIHYYFTFFWCENLNELFNNAISLTVPIEIREPCHDFG